MLNLIPIIITIPAVEEKQIPANLGNTITDWSRQRIGFETGNAIRWRDPTLAEWNYQKNGLLLFDGKIPNVTITDKTKLDYKPELHPAPGTWEQ